MTKGCKVCSVLDADTLIYANNRLLGRRAPLRSPRFLAKVLPSVTRLHLVYHRDHCLKEIEDAKVETTPQEEESHP